MKKEKDNMYSERSMVLYKVTFNERNSPDEVLPIHDIDGLSCVELFYQFVDAKKDELISLRGGNKFIKISACEQVEDMALIKVTSGSSGENVDVVDVDSGDTEYTYGTDKAAMIDSRCLVSQLSGTSYAFLCVEHTRNGAGDTSLFDPFRSFLRDKAPKAVVKFETLIEPEVLENFISVENVEIKEYLEAGDQMDLLVLEAATRITKLTHKRGRSFPVDLYRKLVDTKGKAAATLLGIDERAFDEKSTEVSVTLKHRSGVKRTFIISDPLGVKIREVLNHDGEKPFTDERFISECESRCDSAASRIGTKLD